MLRLYLMNEFLIIFCHVGELAAIALPYVLAPCAQPKSLILKVVALLVVEVSSVQIVLPPIIVIALLGACEIAEAQTGLCPPEIFLGPMNLPQHDGFFEQQKQESAISVVLPEMSQLIRAGCERSLRVEHAPIIDRLQLPKVTHKNHRDVAKRAIVRV